MSPEELFRFADTDLLPYVNDVNIMHTEIVSIADDNLQAEWKAMNEAYSQVRQILRDTRVLLGTISRMPVSEWPNSIYYRVRDNEMDEACNMYLEKGGAFKQRVNFLRSRDTAND